MRKFALTVLSVMAIPAYSADLTDILFNRSASATERFEVSQEITSLPMNDAIGELCYDIDICASLTPQEELETSCNYAQGEEAKKYSEACQILEVRKTHSCIPSSNKMTLQTLRIFKQMVSDMNQIYSIQTSEKAIASITTKYPELKDIVEDPKALEDYFEKNPEVRKEIEYIMGGSAALAQYTMDCFSRMNPILFSKDNKKINRYYNLYASTINTLDFFPEYKGKVNRGTSLPGKVLDEHLKVGNIVCYDGFTSTAVHNPKTDMGDNPSNTFLENKCGQRLYIEFADNGAVPGRLIDSGSAFKGEKEVLFSPGACFSIDKVTPRTDNSDPENEMKCPENARVNIEMTLVPSK